MYGRNNDYTLPASSSTGFPVFDVGDGALVLAEGNNTLDSIGISSSDEPPAFGVIVLGNNVLMNNLQLTGFKFNSAAVYIDGAQNVTLQNSNIEMFNNGVTVADGATATLQDNTIFTSGNPNPSDPIIGVEVLDGSNVTLNRNTITVETSPTVNSASPSVNPPGSGLYLSGGSTVTGSNNVFNISGTDPLIGIWNEGGTANISASTFNIHNQSVSGGNVRGIFSDDANAVTTVSNSTFNIDLDGVGIVYGVYNNAGTVNITNDTFDINAVGSASTCIDTQPGATTNSTGNTFIGCIP
jgi:hypothetical protein